MTQSVKTTSLYKSYISYSSQSSAPSVPLKADKPHESHIALYGATTIGAVAGLGLLFFLFSKGGPRRISAFLKRKSDRLNEKMSSMLSANKDSVNRKTYLAMKKLSSMLSYLQGITNAASLKDMAFKKILPKRYHEIASSIFKKSAVKTVNNSYTKAFSDIEEFLQTAVENAGTANKAEVEKLVENVRFNLNKSFEHFARRDRRNFIENEFENLDAKVINVIWDAVKNKQGNKFITFVAEDLAQPAKNVVNNEINAARRLITNNISAISKDLNKCADEIKSTLSPGDTESFKSINRIRNLIKDYTKLSGSAEKVQRRELSETIVNETQELIRKINTSNMHEKSVENIRNAQKICEILNNSKKGNIEEILTILRNSTDEETYKKIIYPQAQKAIKSLIKANEYEGIKLVDKIRDIEVGSACCDSATLLGGVALTGAYMANTHSQEEFVSAGLKSGFPAVATLGSVFYATSRLLSGGVAIIFGLATGFLCNAFGTKVNEITQKQMAKQKEMKKVYNMYQANNKSFTS